ncbi:MAG: nucleoside triphosphate pyrophosphohydrolase [Candidatus Moranbacteria bacterium]|nr:nucleoside triphosphate pyrophosphohydrolase [Candidatus Moranbacteria bacterium]
MRYDKLVRDKIPELIGAKGEECLFHIAEDEEYATKLYEKLREETEELIRERNIGEVADVLEVVDAIISREGFSRNEVEAAKSKKREERGGFGGRIILDES